MILCGFAVIDQARARLAHLYSRAGEVFFEPLVVLNDTAKLQFRHGLLMWALSGAAHRVLSKKLVEGALLCDEGAERVADTTRCLRGGEERRRLEKSVRKSERNAGLARQRLAGRADDIFRKVQDGHGT